jgi:hypothetical protein
VGARAREHHPRRPRAGEGRRRPPSAGGGAGADVPAAARRVAPVDGHAGFLARRPRAPPARHAGRLGDPGRERVRRAYRRSRVPRRRRRLRDAGVRDGATGFHPCAAGTSGPGGHPVRLDRGRAARLPEGTETACPSPPASCRRAAALAIPAATLVSRSGRIGRSARARGAMLHRGMGMEESLRSPTTS